MNLIYFSNFTLYNYLTYLLYILLVSIIEIIDDYCLLLSIISSLELINHIEYNEL